MRQRRYAALAALVASMALTASSAHAVDRWVDASYTGSTSNGSSTQPFKKISDAYSVIQPGDTVRVRPGTYYEGVWLKSGTSNTARVTYKSEVKWGAKIVTPASNQNGGCFQYWGGGIIDNVSTPSVWTMNDSNGNRINPCGWVTIDGFDLHSNKQSDSTGAGTWLQWVHHITIRNCWSHNNAMAGLGGSLCDYMIIENNVVNDNAGADGSGTINIFSSGIGIWKVRPWDTAAGPHNIIRGNVVFNNHNDLSNPNRSDGNGIIIDTTAFDKGTVVENNLVVNNGGGGILLDGTANCTVRYNTLYRNSWDKDYPEIYASKVTWEPSGNLENSVCKNTNIYGNLVVASTNRLAVKTNADNTGNIVHHNLRWYNGQATPTNVPAFYGNDGNLTDSAGLGDVTGQDPQLVNPSTNTWASDFHLQHYSPALNRNDVNTLDGKDLDGQNRTGTGVFVDLGAYEYRGYQQQPGFEGMTGFGTPYASQINGGTITIQTNNGRQHVGSKSAQIATSSGAAGRWNSLYQTLSGLSPNTTYTVTAWVRGGSGTIGANTWLGAQTTSFATLASTPITPSGGGYTKHIATFNTGSLTSLLVSLGYNAPLNQYTELWIDDISVNVKTTLPTP
jgi:parallel beta-helix repeat protein